jgi:hypothetical protein
LYQTAASTAAGALFPSLATITGDLIVEQSSIDGTLELPGLISVVGKLRIAESTMTQIALPSLESVGDDLIVFENPAMTELELTRLQSVGSNLIIANNPRYPRCQAEEIAARVASGVSGDVAITGNDEEASCSE